jgi:GTPase SAR1 family protein
LKEEERNTQKSDFYLILGPPNSGKTTLTYRLYSGIYYQGIQMSKRNLEEVKVDLIRLRTLNIWENELNEEKWKPLSYGCVGVILLVDISSQKGLADGRKFYDQIIKSSPVFKGKPKLIFGNKTDLRSYDEITLSSDLKITERQNDFIIQCISCKTTEGIKDGMNKLMEKTNARFHIPAFRKLNL